MEEKPREEKKDKFGTFKDKLHAMHAEMREAKDKGTGDLDSFKVVDFLKNRLAKVEQILEDERVDDSVKNELKAMFNPIVFSLGTNPIRSLQEINIDLKGKLTKLGKE